MTSTNVQVQQKTLATILSNSLLPSHVERTNIKTAHCTLEKPKLLQRCYLPGTFIYTHALVLPWGLIQSRKSLAK